ncbi:hypothetical protein FOPG_18892 [Fusarium oxysporum f. sp. conglutinans race 2 54008]|uniref:Endonuclease/exonuclease/phosphatase domain-containing protein n=1 Tax=Fusarium oxysporum f. sp. conglutinans race 2 54008 TaxID=1089457 RepID=X0GMM8_FUSOX|nr:hypothetical protein FOPG_18892 [Fusarium oxysporum f. sp. conglutinans race 2 54008]
MIRQLQQEVWAVKVQATEESRKADELRRLHEQSTRQLRVIREQMNEQIKTIREQPAKELEQLREEMKQVKEDTKQALVVSVYVAGKDEEALRTAMRQLHTTIASLRSSTGKRTDIMIAGDFNRHDQLWGGGGATMWRAGDKVRQGRSLFSWTSMVCSVFSKDVGRTGW